MRWSKTFCVCKVKKVWKQVLGAWRLAGWGWVKISVCVSKNFCVCKWKGFGNRCLALGAWRLAGSSRTHSKEDNFHLFITNETMTAALPCPQKKILSCHFSPSLNARRAPCSTAPCSCLGTWCLPIACPYNLFGDDRCRHVRCSNWHEETATRDFFLRWRFSAPR